MSRQDRTAGFTLVELLIAIMISGLVFTVVASAFVISISSNNDTNGRLLEANAANSFSSWFTQDVQSALTLSTTVRRCIDTSGDLLVSVERDEATVDYVYIAGADGGRVMRRTCGVAELAVAVGVIAPSVLCLPDPNCTSASGARAELRLEGQPVTVTGTRRAQ